jgi:hypothetical protein
MKNKRILLFEFIALMDSFKITPSESHIDSYLNEQKDKNKLRVYFIKFCFYYWERRKDEIFIDKLMKYEII